MRRLSLKLETLGALAPDLEPGGSGHRTVFTLSIPPMCHYHDQEFPAKPNPQAARPGGGTPTGR